MRSPDGMTRGSDRPLRILVLAPIYPPAVGGAATYFGGLLPTAARHPDIQAIHVITECFRGAPSSESDSRLSIARILPTRVGEPRRTRLGHATSYLGTQLWLAANLRKRVRSTGSDLVHVHTRFRGRMFFSALARCGVPIVADLRDRRTDLGPWLRVADRLVCVIESVRDEAVAAGFPEGRTAVVRTPLIIPPSLLDDPKGAARATAERHGLGSAPYVLSVGDVAAHKGIPELVEGFGRWRAAHPEARLVVAGVNYGGPAMAAALDAAPGVIRLGPVEREEALALMAGAAIVIRPSHRSEGLPRVIQEAVAMGAKVIAPPGVPEFDAAMPECVLDSVTPEAIERALEAAWRREGPPTLDLSEHEPERVAESLVKVYRSAVDGVAGTGVGDELGVDLGVASLVAVALDVGLKSAVGVRVGVANSVGVAVSPGWIPPGHGVGLEIDHVLGGGTLRKREDGEDRQQTDLQPALPDTRPRVGAGMGHTRLPFSDVAQPL